MTLADPTPPDRRARRARVAARVLDREGRLVIGSRHLERWERWRIDRVEVREVLTDVNDGARRVEGEQIGPGRWELRRLPEGA